MSNKKYGPSIKVRFAGITFYRYPESPSRAQRAYYVSNRGLGLHRAIWAATNGPIPAGYHIHHIDGNPLNNDISNLQLLERSEHLSEHWTPEMRQRARERMPAVQKLAGAWHRTEAGRAFHREHGRKWVESRVVHDLTCTVCGAAFQSVKPAAQCCSQKCVNKRRWHAGLDHVEFTCRECGATYKRHKRQPNAGFCGRRCAARVTWRERTKASTTQNAS